MKILILVAGTNTPSNADFLADRFAEGLRAGGATEIVKLRLKDLTIEHFTVEHYGDACPASGDFCRVQEHMLASRGVVLATPIWNFSVPAHLKNLIDRMGSFALDATRSKGQLKGLPFYCIFTGGAPRRAWVLMRETTSHIGKAIEYFGGIHAGTHFEPSCMQGKGVFGLVVHERPGTIAAVHAEGKKFAEAIRAGTVHHRGNWLLRIGMWTEGLLERWKK